MKSPYRYAITGQPFMPAGIVLKGDVPVARLEYEGQDERLLVTRLAEIVRLLARIDRKMGRTKP